MFSLFITMLWYWFWFITLFSIVEKIKWWFFSRWSQFFSHDHILLSNKNRDVQIQINWWNQILLDSFQDMYNIGRFEGSFKCSGTFGMISRISTHHNLFQTSCCWEPGTIWGVGTLVKAISLFGYNLLSNKNWDVPIQTWNQILPDSFWWSFTWWKLFFSLIIIYFQTWIEDMTLRLQFKYEIKFFLIHFDTV